MAAIWKGSLTFGLVNIPVELKTAVRADHISFEAPDSGVLNLMSRLRASLEEGSGKKGATRAKGKSVAACKPVRAKKAKTA